MNINRLLTDLVVLGDFEDCKSVVNNNTQLMDNTKKYVGWRN